MASRGRRRGRGGGRRGRRADRYRALRRRRSRGAAGAPSRGCLAMPVSGEDLREDLTRPGDAAAAVAAGASYLGVVFAGGPRRVYACRWPSEISRAGGAIPVFGVFGDQTVEEILATSRAVRGWRGRSSTAPYGREAARPAASRGARWSGGWFASPRRRISMRSTNRCPMPTPCWSKPGCRIVAGGAGVALDLAVARAAAASAGRPSRWCWPAGSPRRPLPRRRHSFDPRSWM